jgi:hypothetical protein
VAWSTVAFWGLDLKARGLAAGGLYSEFHITEKNIEIIDLQDSQSIMIRLIVFFLTVFE